MSGPPCHLVDDRIARALADVGGVTRRSDLREMVGWRLVASAEGAGLLQAIGVRSVAATSISDVTVRFRSAQVDAGIPIIAALHTAASLHGFGVIDDGLIHATTWNGW